MLLPVEGQGDTAFQHHQHIERAAVAGGGLIGLQHLNIRMGDAHTAGQRHLFHFSPQHRAGVRGCRRLPQQREAVVDTVSFTKRHKLADGESFSRRLAGGFVVRRCLVHAVVGTGKGASSDRVTLPLRGQSDNKMRIIINDCGAAARDARTGDVRAFAEGVRRPRCPAARSQTGSRRSKYRRRWRTPAGAV